METIQRSALVNFSASQMYDLVDDVESYADFVPYCKKTEIIERNSESLTATLSVARSGIAKSFTTKNTMQVNQSITMTLVDGPFKHLSGRWIFTPLTDQACKIELDLSFEFANKLASFAFKKIFHQLIESMVDAFTQRAEKVYG